MDPLGHPGFQNFTKQLAVCLQPPNLPRATPKNPPRDSLAFSKLGWTQTCCHFELKKLTLKKPNNYTPKTNMEPENHLVEKENHLPSLHFWILC